MRLYILGVLCIHSSLSLCEVSFFCQFRQKHCGCIFEDCHMMNFLGYWSGVILVGDDNLLSCAIFWFFPLLGSHGAVLLVWILWLYLFSFLTIYLLLGAPVEIYWVVFLFFLIGSPVGVPLGIPPILAPLEVLHGWLDALLGSIFNWFFLLGSPVGFSMGMPHLLEPSYFLLGRLIFQKDLLGISMPPCLCILVWLVFWKVLDSTVH